MRLYVGGTRSGKSALAQRWVESHASGAPESLLFIATCRVEDDEMAARVAAHKEQRGPVWRVCEAAIDPLAALQNMLTGQTPEIRAVLVDCVSVWIANLLAAKLTPEAIRTEVVRLAHGLSRCELPCALVSAEVGMGLVPTNALGRQFRDVLGEANQILAKASDTVIFASCGLPLALKGNLDQ